MPLANRSPNCAIWVSVACCWRHSKDPRAASSLGRPRGDPFGHKVYPKEIPPHSGHRLDETRSHHHGPRLAPLAMPPFLSWPSSGVACSTVIRCGVLPASRRAGAFKVSYGQAGSHAVLGLRSQRVQVESVGDMTLIAQQPGVLNVSSVSRGAIVK